MAGEQEREKVKVKASEQNRWGGAERESEKDSARIL